MSIPFSGGTIVHDQVDAATVGGLINAIEASLVSAGWTPGQVAASVTGTFTGLPANAQTVTIAGQAYIFKTVLASAYDVLIGGTAAACASNLFDAITDNSGNEGVTYGTGTAAHTTCTATVNGATITVTYLTAGGAGNGIAVSETLNNFTWAFTTLANGGSMLSTAITPDGLSGKLRIDWDRTANQIRLVAFSSDEMSNSQSFYLSVASERLLEVQVCRYQLLIYLFGSAGTNNTFFFFTVPKLRDVHVPATVETVTLDSGTGSYVVNTGSTPHGRSTGEHVYIDGPSSSVGLNGWHQITVIDDYNYILDGSIYDTGYVDGSAVSASPRQISRAIFVSGEPTTGNVDRTFRNCLVTVTGSTQEHAAWYCFNQFAWNATVAGSNYGWGLKTTARAKTGTGGLGVEYFAVGSWGGYADELEARISWPVAAAGGTIFDVGNLWNAFVVVALVAIDVELFDFLGYHWRQITNGGSTYSNQPAAGSLWVVLTVTA